MTRRWPQPIAWTLAASLAALAGAFAAIPRDAAPHEPAGAPAAPAPSLVDTLILLRWGQGALDWNLPDVKGERDVPHRDRA
jgi:hypothetical protein